MSFRSHWWTSVLLFAAGLSTAAPAAEWRVLDVDGLAVSLVKGSWREIAPGDLLNDPVMQTLRRAHVRLGFGGTTVLLGPGAAASFGQPSRAALIIKQYAGSIVADCRGTSAAGLTIAAGRLTVTNVSGAIVVAISDATTAVVLQAGDASVRLDGGTAVHLKDHEMVSTGSGTLVIRPVALTTSVEAATLLAEAELENSSKANNGNSNAGGNGNANTGDNGNAGGNGSGNNGNGAPK